MTLDKAEMNNVLSILYVIVEVGRWQVSDGEIPSIRKTIGRMKLPVTVL